MILKSGKWTFTGSLVRRTLRSDPPLRLSATLPFTKSLTADDTKSATSLARCVADQQQVRTSSLEVVESLSR